MYQYPPPILHSSGWLSDIVSCSMQLVLIFAACNSSLPLPTQVSLSQCFAVGRGNNAPPQELAANLACQILAI